MAGLGKNLAMTIPSETDARYAGLTPRVRTSRFPNRTGGGQGRTGLATFYIDGGSVGNQKKGIPRRARIAIVYQPGSGPTATTGPRVLVEEVGDRTNNEAEYLALLKLLSLLEAKWTGPDGRSSHQTEPIRILSDSELIVNQVRGDYKVKEERLSRLRDEVLKILEKSPSITIEWIPRKENLAGMWLEGLLRAKQVSAGELLSDRNG